MRARHWFATITLALAAGWTATAAGIDRLPPSAADLRYPPSPSWSGSDRYALGVSPRGKVYLSWLEPVGGAYRALKFSTLEGPAWSLPRTVADSDDWTDLPGETPRLVPQDDGTLLAHWIQNRGLPGDQFYALRVVRSADGSQWYDVYRGRPDSRPIWPRFVHLFGHSGDATGIFLEADRGQTPALQLATFGLASRHAPDVAPFPIAACNGIAVASEPGDAIVAYRPRQAAGDITVAHLAGDRWDTPVPVTVTAADTACQGDPPVIDRRGPLVALAWLAESREVRVALAHDRGRHFVTVVGAAGVRPLSGPSVAVIDDGSAVVAWVEEGRTSPGDLLLRRIWPDGRQSPVLAVASLTAAASTRPPRLALHDDTVVVAWQGDRIRTALVPLDRLARAAASGTSF